MHHASRSSACAPTYQHHDTELRPATIVPTTRTTVAPLPLPAGEHQLLCAAHHDEQPGTADADRAIELDDDGGGSGDGRDGEGFVDHRMFLAFDKTIRKPAMT